MSDSVSQILLLAALIFAIIAVASLVKAVKNRLARRKTVAPGNPIPGRSNQPIPDDALVFTEGGILTGKRMNEAVRSFQQGITDLIQRHLEGMMRVIPDPRAVKPLRDVIGNLELVKMVVCEKMSLSINDGKGHSKAFMEEKSKVYVNISCWPCPLSQLRARYEAEIGPYLYSLAMKKLHAQSNGAESLVEIFFCHTSSGGGGVTATLMHMPTGVCVKPNELIDDAEIDALKAQAQNWPG